MALGVAKELQPVWVREGDDEVEALSVVISLKHMKIRCCAAYGCQESDPLKRKEAFWAYLDEEVIQADLSGDGFVLHFDGNLWAGDELVPGDPRPQNRNGKKFEEFLKRNPHLSVVNSLSLCEGLITRRRVRDGKEELSVLDFFVVCARVLPHVTKMVVDEAKQHVLTNYQRVKKDGKAVDSDHVTEYMDLDIRIEKEKPKRIEMFNFKEKDGQLKFHELTSETDAFTKCFEDENMLLKQVDKWHSVLMSFCKDSFKKIRIRNEKIKPLKSSLNALIDNRNQILRDPKDSLDLNKIELINKRIADIEAEENHKKIIENFKHLSDNPDQINMQQMWKKFKTLWPKSGISLPTGKRNFKGKIVSGPRDIKLLLSQEYKHRLRNRPFRPDLESINLRKKKIFEIKM